MALLPIRIGRLQGALAAVDPQGRFTVATLRAINGIIEQIETAFLAIQQNIADIIAAQAAADAAQDAAIQAAADAATAQASADQGVTDAAAAYALASTAVQQDVGPAWGTSSGTASRSAYAAYTGQVVSAIPTQAEVQAIDDALVSLSRHMVALIADLRANGALT